MKSRKSAKGMAHAVLAVVAIFVLGVAATLVVNARLARVETPGPAASSADLRIKEAQIEEEAHGVRWRLKADQALVFEDEGRTHLKRVHVNVFERERSWTIVGDEGDLYQASKNVEVRRNVVVTSSDGLRLETTVLRWQGEERRLWTDAPVRMAREGTVVDGSALDVRMGDEATTIRGRVRATFVKGPARR